LLEHEPELVDCETCPIREARGALSPGNLQALDAFDLLARRVVYDFQLSPLVFEALKLKMRPDEVRPFVEALDLIYEHRCPVKRHGE
jgi:hypothetical protein